MKKAAIVTQYYRSYNYGGVLQAYALQNCLRDMGCENEVALVEFRAGLAESFSGRQRRSQQKRKKKPLSVRVWRELRRKLERRLFAKRRENFDRFKDAFITSSDTVYTDANLRGANDRYDCFITGSDQVWNPNQSCDAFFLTFAEDGHRKISYAASIGMDTVSDEYLQYMAPLVDRLDAVSVREPSAVKILSGHVHKDVCCVLDPTLLLPREKWEELCRPVKQKGGYIFVYLLGRSEQNYRLIQAVSKKLKTPVVLIPGGKLDKNTLVMWDKWALNASPADFLSLLHNARYVITDSFHGTVFSILFHKDFCAVERGGAKGSSPMNARLYDLLGTAGLEERMQHDATDAADILQKQIDYGPVDARLAEKIEYSKDYLRRALELNGTAPEAE